MLDRNISFYNMILRCDHIMNSEIKLPDGYTFRFYEPGDEKEWAKLEYEIGDFGYRKKIHFLIMKINIHRPWRY